MAHSKRNTSLPHFTSYERSLLRNTWGSQRTRLNRDSFLPFSSCRLCLQPARAPVVACSTNGDIFCRECAVNDLLAQRKEIKRLEKERDAEEKEREQGEGRLMEEAKERELREFEMVSMGLEEREKKRKKREDDDDGGGGGDEEVEKLRVKRRKGFELDEREMERIASSEREKVRRKMEEEKEQSSKSQLPSFWVPSLTPSTADGKHPAKPAKLEPICPASSPTNKHGYSLKGLVTVNFTEEKDDKSGETARICPSCKKGLSNGMKSMLTKPCGHVICKSCVDKFMTPHENPDPHAREADELHGRMLCYVCDTDITERKAKNGKKEKNHNKEKIKPGLVMISSEGTGFAGGGQNIAKREGTAFQC